MNALPTIAETIAMHGLRADKRLGQHFLTDPNLLHKIVRQAGSLQGQHVLEIGPGPGGLTRALLESEAESVTAIEMDARCIAALQKLKAAHPQRFTLLEGDALKVDILQAVPAPRGIVANLPYNAGTAMVIQWLQHIAADAQAYAQITVMLQKEVVDRLAARPSTKDYGRISVLAQWLCDVQPCFMVPPGAFSPPPKVDSAVVRLVPRAAPVQASLAALERVTAAAFGQRRKMLRQSLKPVGGEALCEAAGVDPTLRADALPVEAYLRLAAAYAGR